MFNRAFLAVAGLNFIILIPYYLLLVLSVPYAVERFNATASIGGLVAGVMILGILVGRFFSGRLIGLIGSQKVLLFGLVEFVVTTALYLVADSLPLLVAVRFCSGIGVGFIGTVTSTLIAHITPPERLGVGISYFSLSTILGMAIGPFLGVLCLGRVPFPTIFLFCCGVGLLCLVFAVCLAPSIPPDDEARKSATALRLSEYVDHRALPVSLVMMLVSCGYGCVQAFTAFHAESIGLIGSASAFFPVYAAVVLLSRPFTGRLVDRRGANIVVYPALAAQICGLALLASASSPWAFLLAAALIGCGFGNFQSICQVISVKAVPRDRIAQATSTFFIFFELGVGCGPYFFGKIVPLAGYHGLFLAVAAVTAASMPVYFFLHGRKV